MKGGRAIAFYGSGVVIGFAIGFIFSMNGWWPW